MRRTSRDFCHTTTKLRKPLERRTFHMSRNLQRLPLKDLEMANVKQRHLRRFARRFGRRLSHVTLMLLASLLVYW